MIAKYYFANNDLSVKRLRDNGFEVDLPFLTHYYWMTVETSKDGKSISHALFIDIKTGILSYAYNLLRSTDQIDVDMLEPVVAEKINKLLATDLIRARIHYKKRR